MIGGASGCGLCPWSSSRKVGAYVAVRVQSMINILDGAYAGVCRPCKHTGAETIVYFLAITITHFFGFIAMFGQVLMVTKADLYGNC